MTAAERPIVSPVLLPARTWAAPGRAMFGVAIVLAVVMLEASSRQSWGIFFLVALACMAMLAIWLFLIVPTLVHRRLDLRASEWARWIGLPALLVATYLSFASPIPFALRLAASRDAMDAAAAQLMADPDASPGWIGLYPIDRIDRFDGGFRFLIWGAGLFDPIGFAYSAEGEPPIVGEDRYAPIDDGWWHWTESW